MDLMAIGTYTHHRSGDIDARGEGILIAARDPADGALRIVDRFSGLRNPSYLHWEPGLRRLYAVSEVGDRRGAVAAFDLTDDGRLHFLGQSEGPGRSACHVRAIPDLGLAAAASYSDGRLTAYRLGDDGAIGPPAFQHAYAGAGPNPERQESSHAHQVMESPWAPVLYLVDLGGDRVWMHPKAKPEAPPSTALEVPAGYGPRHLAFDPLRPAAYLLCELEPRLLVLRIDPADGRMRIEQELQAADDGTGRTPAPAAVKLHPSGRSLACSSRFDDSITVFAVDRPEQESDAPRLRLMERFESGGRTPRDIEFTVDGRVLFIANQDSHNITGRRFDDRSGRPERDRIPPLETGSPVCLVQIG